MNDDDTRPMPQLLNEPTGTLAGRRRIRSIVIETPPITWTPEEVDRVLRVLEDIRIAHRQAKTGRRFLKLVRL